MCVYSFVHVCYSAGLDTCVCVCVFLQGTLCDVTLVVQGKHISAHRVVLAAASHFFSLMFTSKCAHTLTHKHSSPSQVLLVFQNMLILQAQSGSDTVD